MLTFAVATVGFIAARTEAERQKVKNPPAPHFFKLVWFLLITAFEWHLISHQPWLPTMLGGKGEGSLLTPQPAEDLSGFYEIQLAYHFHSLLFALIVGAKKEMFVHHVVTLCLVILSDRMDYRRMGSIIFVLHDLADVPGYAVKTFIHAKQDIALVLSYVVLLFTWSYTRMYLFLHLIFYILTEEEGVDNTHRVFFSTLLSSLLVLHYYWYGMFILLGYNFFRRGKVKDLSEAPGNRDADEVIAKATREAQLRAEELAEDKEQQHNPKHESNNRDDHSSPKDKSL